MCDQPIRSAEPAAAQGAQRCRCVVCTTRAAGWPGVDGAAGAGLLPPLFQPAQQSCLDLGCDVAVGLDQPVGQVVSEAFGLGDLGDAVGDQPRLVAVPQPVKGQAGPSWGQAAAGIAVGRWAAAEAI